MFDVIYKVYFGALEIEVSHKIMLKKLQLTTLLVGNAQ